MVKVVKQTLERCKRIGNDPHIALLMYRATPLKSDMASPAELLNQRKFHTTLPSTNKMSQQQKQARKKMEREKRDITETYNKRARQFRELSQHEPVYVQLDPNQSRWQRATITRTPTESQPRNYEVMYAYIASDLAFRDR
ncbi:hypothetical protein CAPTEDRAFT_185109 [Capitella teleta]|uniref:Uncharacterized protein n=1 Tax=Capitella teleta TaxID=283909 RepID=R7VLV0_CAPTE|nr:hypothetical protein CAPTEDRAFT_185109 [Capitella teleta]|eukprot:ELU18586.1 hypothetical protein CAPTEDRAFT_185109 [Capitella teleta]